MRLKVTKEFTFDAAHHLTKYYGKCERPHGHTYKLLVTVSGKQAPNGLVIDFVILKRIIKKHILSKLDHYNLNEIMENPSCERIAKWIWSKLENINKLIKEEFKDPNLDEEIKIFLKKETSPNLKNKENEIRLESITLFETPTSSVTIDNEN